METSKAWGGVLPRLFKRIAFTVFAFTAAAGIAFALFTNASEAHLKHISETVKAWEAPSKPTKISKCGAFNETDEIWKESQLKYQHLRDDKFTYVPTLPRQQPSSCINLDCLILALPCKPTADRKN